MPVTAYCKKCGQDVPVGDVCPLCGRSLPKSVRRVAWCLRTRPAADWLCWNAAARIILPAALAVLAIVLLTEFLAGGANAAVQLITGGLITTVLLLLALVALLLMIILRLQGDSLLDCVLDSKGVHVQTYLPYPTPLKLMMRLCSPSLMDKADWDCAEPMVLTAQKEIAWRDVMRVQLWPEKQLILLYAPRWWMRIAIYATPLTWNDALNFLHEKIGKKKGVILPREMTLYMEQAAALEQEMLQNPEALTQLEETADNRPSASADSAADIPPLEDVLHEVQTIESSIPEET